MVDDLSIILIICMIAAGKGFSKARESEIGPWLVAFGFLLAKGQTFRPLAQEPLIIPGSANRGMPGIRKFLMVVMLGREGCV